MRPAADLRWRARSRDLPLVRRARAARARRRDAHGRAADRAVARRRSSASSGPPRTCACPKRFASEAYTLREHIGLVRGAVIAKAQGGTRRLSDRRRASARDRIESPLSTHISEVATCHRFPAPTSSPAAPRRTPPSRCAAGCARAATPRRASRSCTSPTARASTRCRWSRPTTLPNYASEVQHLTAGCAIEATGTLVPSPGKGQTFEMQAAAIARRRLGRRSRDLPAPAEAAHARVPARGRPPAAAHQRLRRGRPRAAHDRAVDPPLLPRARLPLGPHADHHRQRLRGRGRDVPRHHARPRQPAAHAGRAKSTSRRTSSAREAYLTVSGQLERRDLLPARCRKVYTFGPTFRAENSNTSRHLAEFWMIEPEMAFSDLADNVDLAEALLKRIFRDRARRARRGHGVLRRAHRQGRHRHAAGHRRHASSCA